jgi:hypothetical protein
MARRTRLGRSTQRLSNFGRPWKMNNKQIKDLELEILALCRVGLMKLKKTEELKIQFQIWK